MIVSLTESEGAVECWGVNDTLEDVEGTLVTGIMRTSGEILAERRIAVEIPANSSVELYSMLLPSWISRPVEFVYARMVRARRTLCDSVRLLDWFRFLSLGKAHIETAVSHVKGGSRMELASRNFCRMVELVLPDGVTADENFFDLYPGKKVTVGLAGPRGKIERVKIKTMNRLKRV